MFALIALVSIPGLAAVALWFTGWAERRVLAAEKATLERGSRA